MPEGPDSTLSADYVRKVASLSRLAITDAEVEDYRVKLSAVLGYVEQLRSVDLTGVEPLVNVAQATGSGGGGGGGGGGGEGENRLDADVPGPTLSNATLMKLAPEGARMEPFIGVPKVIDDGGGA